MKSKRRSIKKRHQLNETIEKLKEKWAAKNSPKREVDSSEESWRGDENSPNADLKLQLDESNHTRSNKILNISKSNKSFNSDIKKNKHIIFKTNNQSDQNSTIEKSQRTIKSNRLSTSAPKHNANPYNDRKTGEMLNKRMSQNMSVLKNRVNKFPAIPLPSNNYRDRNN